MRKGKRGLGHVEVILSFVLFIVAVGFALYFFNPAGGDRLVESSLTYAFREISQNTSVGVETFSVVINNSEIPTSTNMIVLEFSGIEGKTRVETYDGDVLESLHEDEFIYVSSGDWNSIAFVFVMFGEEFEETDGLSGTHDANYYEVGSSNLKEVISEKRFLVLNQTYYKDYLTLKGEEQFNLPDMANFGFSLVFDENDFIIAEKEIPAGLEVFSETERVEVLRDNGNIIFADLIVKVW
ncbi:MAG: hypothetical protein KJ718_05445 [Nanoarchaeota archaeon]|nr:hypothetical protein [Nanoarchaeota archaeon]MBU1051967.1 hypothetical protein [Nanoarchaeota archaeon]MBU1988307.1 hypothetical protein [Nanoarchaeota archaeon]